MPVKKIDHWKKLEDATQEVLEGIQRKEKLTYERFYDTRSAGNYLPQQKSDFHVCYEGRAVYIECKFSEKHESLRGCFSANVSPEQLASARLVNRAGGKYWFLFYSPLSYKFELWDGYYCACKMGPLHLKERRLFDTLEQAVRAAIAQ